MGQHRTNRRKPLTVAVCIPTIPGREKYLNRAAASARAQTRLPDRILVERDSLRLGAAAARNALLERVDTDVIAWLDDDDALRPNHIKACMRALSADPGIGLVYPQPVMVNGPDPTACTYQGVFPRSPWGVRWCPELEQHLRLHGSFIPMTHLVRTDLVRAAGGFPEGRTVPGAEGPRYQGEDERYLIALLDAGARFEHLPVRTWNWTVNPKSTSGKPSVLASSGLRLA